MSIQTSRAQRRQMQRDNAKQPATLQEVPRELWPPRGAPPGLLRVFRSRDYLVQEFFAPPPALARLSVNRTALSGGRWVGDIPWDDLQRIKCECGYHDATAVEVFPPRADVVDVANMRHLWVLSEPLAFAWKAAP